MKRFEKEFGMQKQWIILVLIAVAASSASATTQQSQGFDVGSSTILGIGGGPGSAGNMTTVAANNNQLADNESDGVMTFQMETGALFQGSSAGGAFGMIGTTQDGQVVGQQDQYAGNGFLGSQTQSLNSGFLQSLTKVGGIGAALGMQGFVGGQIQIIADPFNVQANVKNVGINQYKSIGGGPNNPSSHAGTVVSIQNQTFGM